MRYWEDFCSKYGFGDGGAIPTDAEKARQVYVRAVNAKAAELGSNCRVIPYNRPGMHNPWIIISATREFYTGLADVQRLHGTDLYPEKGATKDDPMAEAIAWAMEQDLDQFIRARISIDEHGFAAFLRSSTTRRRRQRIQQ